MCFSLVLLIGLGGCASKKRKDEVGAFKRFYHNTTAKYNGYFNANELLQESFVSLEDQNQDNYNQILHVYPYSAADNPDASAGDLDKAIEKVTTVALLHEPSHWVDDCYLLMGKAQFLKQDYETAEETLEYFQEEFDPNNPNGRIYKKKGKKSKKERQKEREAERKEQEEQKKKEREAKEEEKKKEREARKKEQEEKKKEREKARKDRKKNSKKRKRGTKKRPPKEEKKEETTAPDTTGIINRIPEAPKTSVKEDEDDSVPVKKEKEELKPEGGGLFGHTPAFYEGVLWLSRTYIERENYFSAEYLLNKLENEYPITDEVRREIYPARAYLFVKQKKYDRAIPALNTAIEKGKDKRKKARYAYIIGQIHQLLGQNDKALAAFQRVNDFKPSFEMEFNSKLNIERTKWSKSGSKENATAQLEKFLKEDKYSDFKDQIYYAMGEVNLSQNNKVEAIENFENSLRYNFSNQNQKIESYYRLAGLYYEDEKYIDAKNYYDSTLVVMGKTDDRVPLVSKYASGLTDIAKNLEIVKLQDSLLRLADMPKDELRAFAKAELEKRKETELVAENEPVEDKFAALSNNRRGGPRGPSSFFAYNQSAVLKGRDRFKEKWGNRKLEDNWRRSNRTDATEEELVEEGPVVNESISETEIDRFIENIPTTPPKRAKVEKALEKALFDLGVLYRDRIENYGKSIESLERMRSVFPESEKDLDAMYYLYLSNLDLPNQSRANHYKNLITDKYPESKFARALNDPNYALELQNEAKQVERNYDDTYALFTDGQYQEVFDITEKINGTTTNPELLPKYALLNAMCIGHLKGKEDYISALKQVSNRHPNTPESVRAKEIMRFLKGDEEAFDKALFDEEKDIFSLEENKLHYVILVVYDASNKKINDTKIALSNYHKEYHKLDKLKITDIYLNVEDKSKIILIRKFRNKEKAMKYVETSEKNSKDFVSTKDVAYDLFAISQKNYREVIKEKSVNSYRAFYEKNYKK